MMTAMASAPQGPQFNGYFRDLFLGNGCSGQCAGCSGNANYTSCSGCNGCSCSGGLFSGDRIRSFFSFNGSCNGCCGGSCCGGSAMYSCSGMPMPMGTPMMDMGTPYATPVPTSFYTGGCFGSGIPTMPALPASPGEVPMIPPTNLPGTTPYAQPSPADLSGYTPRNQLPLPGGAAPSPNRATVVVKLPADARLSAEGKTLSLTSAERSFVTPELPTGREYNYTFRVEYDRNGRTLSESRTIAVAPGRVSTLEFADLVQKTDATPVPIPKPMPETKPANTTSLTKSEPTGERANIAVKVPAGATLFVNDAKQTSSEFRTPPLPSGKDFSYTMKIETIRNGTSETATQKVTVRAGDRLTVDFTTAVAGR
jgi:uncharacterized protein (TIGR03000 family)